MTDPKKETGLKSTKLLIDLYDVLSEGSYRYVFASFDTFRALGVPQTEFFDVLCKRILINGYTLDNINLCIDLLQIKADCNTLDSYLIDIFIDNLKVEEIKLVAINILEEKVNNVKEKLKSLDKKDSYIYEYSLETDNNNYVETIAKLYFSSFEVDKGIEYYKDNYLETSLEVKEYCLLDMLEEYELYEDYVKEYENVSKKIKLRESLTERYLKIKNKL